VGENFGDFVEGVLKDYLPDCLDDCDRLTIVKGTPFEIFLFTRLSIEHRIALHG